MREQASRSWYERPWVWIVIVLMTIILLTLLIGGCQSLNRPGPTQVAVIRNGGPFSAKDIREVRKPSSSYAVSGLASEPRMYIAGNENRFYNVSSDPSRGRQSGASFIKVPTKDGVNVEVDAQITFHTAFTDADGNITPCEVDGCEDYDYLVEQFDTTYGNRDFPSKDGGSGKVWEGNSGWNAFLDTLFRPVVENSFRAQIGSVNCADLVSSCALVQSSTQQANLQLTAQDNQENFAAIQKAVQEQIGVGVESALGEEYLTGFKVQLTKVTLPKSVQAAIDTAQASFAEIAKARAQNIQADYQAQANERIARSLKASGDLVFLKAAEALSRNSSATIILGEPGTGLTLGK